MDIQGKGLRVLEVTKYLDFEVQRRTLDSHFTAQYNVCMTRKCFCWRLINITLGFFYVQSRKDFTFLNDSDYDPFLAVFELLTPEVVEIVEEKFFFFSTTPILVAMIM